MFVWVNTMITITVIMVALHYTVVGASMFIPYYVAFKDIDLMVVL